LMSDRRNRKSEVGKWLTHHSPARTPSFGVRHSAFRMCGRRNTGAPPGRQLQIFQFRRGMQKFFAAISQRGDQVAQSRRRIADLHTGSARPRLNRRFGHDDGQRPAKIRQFRIAAPAAETPEHIAFSGGIRRQNDPTYGG